MYTVHVSAYWSETKSIGKENLYPFIHKYKTNIQGFVLCRDMLTTKMVTLHMLKELVEQ